MTKKNNKSFFGFFAKKTKGKKLNKKALAKAAIKGASIAAIEAGILTVEGPWHRCYRHANDYSVFIDVPTNLLTAIAAQPVWVFNIFVLYPLVAVKVAYQQGADKVNQQFKLTQLDIETMLFPNSFSSSERCDAAEDDAYRFSFVPFVN